MAVNLNPVDDDLVHEVKTKKYTKDEEDIVCKIEWKSDHPDWSKYIKKTDSYVERAHVIHAARYLAEATKTSGAASTDVDHRMSWNKDELANTNEMEIFAVIRAEYRFITDGWTKLMAKQRPQGIDNLFYKKKGGTEYYAIVESKCMTNVANYAKYFKGGSPLAKLGKLGKAHPYFPNVKQMSEPWILHCFLQESACKSATVTDALKGLWAFLAGGGETFKWLNVFGTEIFYIIPGVYSSEAEIGIISKTLDDITVDFPEPKYQDEEFFALSKYTNDSGSNALSGEWHEPTAKNFEKMSGKIKVDPKKMAKAKKKIAYVFD